jgi:hypothetical protein
MWGTLSNTRRGSVVYNCCRSLPVQSFLDLSPTELMTIFYCLRFMAPPTWRARSPYLFPPGTLWPSYTPGWAPFLSLPTTCMTTVEVFEPTFTQGTKSQKSKLRHDRWSVGQSVLVSSTHLGLTTRYLLMSDSCMFVGVGRTGFPFRRLP